MTLIPPEPKTPPAPFFYNRIFIGIVCLLIGLLIGWFILPDRIDIHDGPPSFSSYDNKTGVITLPVAPTPNAQFWVTTELIGSSNKGVTVTSSSGVVYPPAHSCSGPAGFWNLPPGSVYSITPLQDAATCATAPPLPTYPIKVPPHTLVTRTGTLTLVNGGRTVNCPIDVYTFTDGSGNTSCITIVLMNP